MTFATASTIVVLFRFCRQPAPLVLTFVCVRFRPLRLCVRDRFFLSSWPCRIVSHRVVSCHSAATQWGELLESKDPIVLPSDPAQMPDAIVHLQRVRVYVRRRVHRKEGEERGGARRKRSLLFRYGEMPGGRWRRRR